MEKTAPKVKSKKKIFWQFAFVAVNIIVVILIATLDLTGEPTIPLADTLIIVRQNWYFLVAALALPLVSIILDVLKYAIMIAAATKRVSPLTAYNCSQLGRYYDNVTPFGAGGQPFQIHYLTTKGIDSGKAMATVITTFIIQQLAFTVLGPVFIIMYSAASYASTFFIVMGWVGYFFYLLIPFMLVIMTVKPSIALAIANFFIRLLTKMKLLKHPERLSARIQASLERYKQTSVYIAKNALRVIVVFIISAIQFAAFFGIPYFVCRALGASADTTVDLFARMVMTYFAITIIPTPGNAIAAEISFLAVFLSVLGGYVFWGILLWRLLVYYLYLVQGLGIIISRTVRDARRLRKYGRNPSLLAAGTGAAHTADAGSAELNSDDHSSGIIPTSAGNLTFTESGSDNHITNENFPVTGTEFDKKT